MKVFITKYALTQGIFEIEAKIDYPWPDMIQGNWVYYHGEGNEWHKTYEAACAKAEDMRQKKIISLTKQIKKLEKLRFGKEIPEKNTGNWED